MRHGKGTASTRETSEGLEEWQGSDARRGAGTPAAVKRRAMKRQPQGQQWRPLSECRVWQRKRRTGEDREREERREEEGARENWRAWFFSSFSLFSPSLSLLSSPAPPVSCGPRAVRTCASSARFLRPSCAIPGDAPAVAGVLAGVEKPKDACATEEDGHDDDRDDSRHGGVCVCVCVRVCVCKKSGEESEGKSQANAGSICRRSDLFSSRRATQQQQ